MDDQISGRSTNFPSLRNEEIAREACLGIMFHLLAEGQRTPMDGHWDRKRLLLLADYARRSEELPTELQGRFDRAVILSLNAERASMDPAELARSIVPREVDVAIITILPEELRAVLNVFGVEEQPHSGQPFYDTQLNCRGRPSRALDVVITSAPKPLNVHVGAPIARLRNKYSPRAAFLVGIAGGRQGRAKRGDIVIGQRVFYYEPGRVTTKGIAPRPQSAEPSNAYGNGLFSYDPHQTNFYARVRDFVTNLSDHYRPTDLSDDQVPEIHRATIASGENVLRDGKVLKEIADRFDDTIRAVDQESYGFADSVRDLPWAVFRGISDTANPKQDDRWKYSAAGLAALCLRDFLETFYVPPDVADL
jgi:adenosylhomocysteine nucleosidase